MKWTLLVVAAVLALIARRPGPRSGEAVLELRGLIERGAPPP